jgi:hypothetical protein
VHADLDAHRIVPTTEFDVHQDQHALVDDFVMHTWKYIERNPGVWRHRYPTLDELKGDFGYDETVLPCVVRQSGTMQRLKREKDSVLRQWHVCFP